MWSPARSAVMVPGGVAPPAGGVAGVEPSAAGVAGTALAGAAPLVAAPVVGRVTGVAGVAGLAGATDVPPAPVVVAGAMTGDLPVGVYVRLSRLARTRIWERGAIDLPLRAFREGRGFAGA